MAQVQQCAKVLERYPEHINEEPCNHLAKTALFPVRGQDGKNVDALKQYGNPKKNPQDGMHTVAFDQSHQAGKNRQQKQWDSTECNQINAKLEASPIKFSEKPDKEIGKAFGNQGIRPACPSLPLSAGMFYLARHDGSNTGIFDKKD